LKNLPAIAATLLEHGRPGDTPAAVVQEGTTAAQRVLRGRLDTIAGQVAESKLRPPAIVVIGHVVDALPPA
jgi:uroporphyrin-III C-methyltransferase/precorrin-2 dehydrogenase/sirohydrochlorin ferrochelatase